MRERDMRARVEAFLGRQVRLLVVPPALGLGLALTTACKAHVPDRPPCTVYDFEDDSRSPCAVSRPDGVPIYSAYAQDPDDSRPSRFPPPEIYIPRPEETARAINAARESCDTAGLRAALLSHGEFSILARTPPDEATYEEMVVRWLATYSQPDCALSKTAADPHPGQPKITGVVSLPAGREWKTALTLVLVNLPLLEQEQASADTRAPIALVDFGGQWRVLPRTPSR
jgi:hypothetical protein